jgi:hypothetical protein
MPYRTNSPPSVSKKRKCFIFHEYEIVSKDILENNKTSMFNGKKITFVNFEEDYVAECIICKNRRPLCYVKDLVLMLSYLDKLRESKSSSESDIIPPKV